ncbi:MAG: hypothetical protein ACOCN7_06835 [Prevotella sp.]
MTTPSIPTSQAFTHGFRHVQSRRLACAVPSASICRPAGFHMPPRRLPFAAPPAPICRPTGCHLAAAIRSQSQQDESLISQS